MGAHRLGRVGLGAKAALGPVLGETVVLITGSMLVIFSGFCFAAGVWRELIPGASPPDPDVRRIPSPLLLSVNGFLGLVAVLALIGIWTAHTPT